MLLTAHDRADLVREAERLLPLIAGFFRPYLDKETLREGVDVDEAAEYVARMVLSHINAQGTWNLDDKTEVKELVELEFLSGVSEVTARQA